MYKSLSAATFVGIMPVSVLSPSLIVLLPYRNVYPTPVDKGSLTALAIAAKVLGPASAMDKTFSSRSVHI